MGATVIVRVRPVAIGDFNDATPVGAATVQECVDDPTADEFVAGDSDVTYASLSVDNTAFVCKFQSLASAGYAHAGFIVSARLFGWARRATGPGQTFGQLRWHYNGVSKLEPSGGFQTTYTLQQSLATVNPVTLQPWKLGDDLLIQAGINRETGPHVIRTTALFLDWTIRLRSIHNGSHFY